MVDGEALVMMMATISSKSPSQQGARTEFLTPERGFAMTVEFRKGFVESDYPPVVLGREGVARGCPRPPHHVLVRPWAHRMARWCGPPCPSPSRLLAPEVFGENRDFAIISGVFPKS